MLGYGEHACKGACNRSTRLQRFTRPPRFSDSLLFSGPGIACGPHHHGAASPQ